MPSFLMLRLDGVMQAWGDHTYEDYRPTVGFPTRSGLLGLLGACIGIDWDDHARLQALDQSVWFTVRAEDRAANSRAEKLTDFHTVWPARKVDIGKESDFPVVSRREYLCDAIFTVAVESTGPQASFDLDEIERSVRRPVFTPSLGRRSCPLSRPLIGQRIEAETALHALASFAPSKGMIYSDSPALACDRQLRLRDVPLHRRVRQFGTRQVFVHAQGGADVPE